MKIKIYSPGILPKEPEAGIKIEKMKLQTPLAQIELEFLDW